jgi:tRNA(fMet)-specific endonuclease VapC
MAVYVLDTDTLSLFQRNHAKVVASVAAHSADVIELTTVNIEEQIDGWAKLVRSARTPDQHESAATFLALLVPSWNRFGLRPMTAPAFTRFELLRKAKLNVGTKDLRIAAIALELSATVVTRNRRDFSRVSGLHIEDWSV